MRRGHAIPGPPPSAARRWPALVALAIAALLIGRGRPAIAAPTVEIKARTLLTLSHVKLRDDGQLEVAGMLTDKLTGEALKGEHVRVTVAGEPITVISGADGSFSATFVGQTGIQQVRLDFDGANRLERADPLLVTTDPAKSQLELSIGKVGDAPAGLRLRVAAVGESGPIQLAVQLEITSATDAKPAWRALPPVDSNQEFTLARKVAGGPGLYRVRATFPGDDTRQRASTEATLELTTATVTSMHLRPKQLAFEDDLVVTGDVRDDDGHPIEHAAVTLSSGDKRLAQGVTVADGSYKFSIEGQLLGEGAWGIQVASDPGKSFVQPSRAAPEVIKVAAPQPVPVSYTIAAAIATALAAGAFFLARKKPWQRFRRPAPPAEVASEPDPAQVPAGGLVIAKPGMMSTLRRAADDGFSGVVRDTVRGRPVADAVVFVVLGDQERELRTGTDGSFALEHLAPGEWRAEVAAAGLITERFAVTIPHRGELRGVRIDLVPVRERVFQLYRRAAEPVLPEPRLWGIWSPRQIVDHVRSKRPSPALAELTDFVEEIYFSARLAAETVLPHASERVDQAIHERTRRGI